MESRTLKFRAWNGKNFIFSFLSNGQDRLGWFFSNTKGFVIQQFTGLSDKNAVEIYEGDIVKYARTKIKTFESCPGVFSSNWIESGEHIGEIVYMGFSFCWSYDHKVYDDIETLGNYPHRFEVIGNIFETPELLK